MTITNNISVEAIYMEKFCKTLTLPDLGNVINNLWSLTHLGPKAVLDALILKYLLAGPLPTLVNEREDSGT